MAKPTYCMWGITKYFWSHLGPEQDIGWKYSQNGYPKLWQTRNFGEGEMLCVVLQWCLVYSILGSMTQENWRSSLYSYSTQQVLTVTRLHTVVKLVHAMPNYNRMPFVATSCCKKSSSLKYHTGEFVTYLMQQPVIFIGVYWSIKNHVISI